MHMFRLAIIITLLLLSGCANYTKRATPAERVDHTSAYLYGRFYIDAPNGALSLDGQVSMGLVMKCDDGSIYNLKFYNANPVFAVKVKPATCSLKEIIYSNVDGYVVERQPYTGTDLQSLALTAGQAYYLGDYAAKFTATLQYRGAIWNWALAKVVRNYEITSYEIKSSYPELSTLPATDITAISDQQKQVIK